jgi:hypothetical protein
MAMARTIVQFDSPVVYTDGSRYMARACGREREDGSWEGWIEFEDVETGEVLPTVRETTQSNLADLTYWATGLSPVYLEGALGRVLKAPEPKPVIPIEPPRFSGPAKRPVTRAIVREPVLDPFSVYEKNPDLLAQELTALRSWHLRQIIRDYGLADDRDVRLEDMTEPELGSLILQRVRDLHA